jgi:hypothetical protein
MKPGPIDFAGCKFCRLLSDPEFGRGVDQPGTFIGPRSMPTAARAGRYGELAAQCEGMRVHLALRQNTHVSLAAISALRFAFRPVVCYGSN